MRRWHRPGRCSAGAGPAVAGGGLLLLAACLFAELGYPGVWRELTAGLAGLPVAAPTPGALAQARRRVGPRRCGGLFDLLRGPAAVPRDRGVWWRGLLVCAIDGTIMTVPDTPANLARVQPSRRRQPRRHRLPAGPAAGPGRVRHPHRHRCGVRPDHQRGDHLCPGPAAQPPAGHDHAGRPELRRRRPGRPDRPVPGQSSWSGSGPAGAPRDCPSCAAAATALTCHVRRRAGAGHRRPDHRRDQRRARRTGALPADHHPARPPPLPRQQPDRASTTSGRRSKPPTWSSSPPSSAAGCCAPAPRPASTQEIYALLVTYQVLRTAMADATATRPGTDPDRASFTIAWQAARDQVIQAAGVIAGDRLDLAGTSAAWSWASCCPPGGCGPAPASSNAPSPNTRPAAADTDRDQLQSHRSPSTSSNPPETLTAATSP